MNHINSTKIDVPLLILGFNDSANIARILNLDFITKIKHIYISIDGPRANNSKDKIENEKISVILKDFSYKHPIKYRIFKENLGIKKSIPGAIDWVLSNHENIIVLEDDVVPTENFINFLALALDKFNNSYNIGAISGYNNVFFDNKFNDDIISTRLSIYPESYAWGTWKNRWNFYNTDSVKSISMKVIYKMTRNILISLAWKINFLLVRFSIIDSWAYCWVSSLWQKNMYSLVPNENLVTYKGSIGRTHTLQKQKWQELPVRIKEFKQISNPILYTKSVDKLVGKKFHNGNIIGIFKLLLYPLYKFITLLRN